MYVDDSLENVSKEDLIAALKETHAAMCGLLWQIEDMRNFDDLLTESHFDDTVPMDRAQYVHQILMTRTVDGIAKRLVKEKEEFDKWVTRCDVARSFVDAGKVFHYQSRHTKDVVEGIDDRRQDNA
jgi:hypothetical protein